MTSNALARVWGAWHPLDLAGGGVPLGTPVMLYDESGDGPGWSWTGGRRMGIENHLPGAIAAAEVAVTGMCDGYVRDSNAYAPLRWYRDRQGIEAYFTAPPSGGTGGAA